LVLNYVAEHHKEIFFNTYLESVKRILCTAKLMEITSGDGKSFDKTIENIKNRIKVDVYNMSNIDPEYEDLVNTTTFLKSLQGRLKIALRPGLTVKEMIVGQYRNFTNILSKQIVNSKDITLSDLTKATGIVFRSVFNINPED